MQLQADTGRVGRRALIPKQFPNLRPFPKSSAILDDEVGRGLQLHPL